MSLVKNKQASLSKMLHIVELQNRIIIIHQCYWRIDCIGLLLPVIAMVLALEVNRISKSILEGLVTGQGRIFRNPILTEEFGVSRSGLACSHVAGNIQVVFQAVEISSSLYKRKSELVFILLLQLLGHCEYVC